LSADTWAFKAPAWRALGPFFFFWGKIFLAKKLFAAANFF
jgi:hypothetical protein